jgi:Protein of unknown function (DUF1573)
MHFFQLRFFVVTLMIIAAVFTASPQAAQRAASLAPHAVVPNLSHDFGSVEQGSKVVHQFTIRNEGTVSLTLTKLSFSELGMTAKMKPAIPPGEETALSIQWDTTRLKGAVVGKAVLEVNDPATPQITLVLKGVVKPGIEFLPYQAIFASVYKGESGYRSVRIVNNRERPLGITRVEQQGEHFHAGIKPVESGKLYELEVTVPATVPTGRYTEAVFLYTDDPTMPRLMVPVNVLVKPDLYANPETVDFGRVALKELADNPSVLDLLTQSVIVRKRAGNFSITNVTSDIPFVTIRRSPEGEGSSEVFRIDVALMKDRLRPGSISGSLRILTDDKQFPELIVLVRGEIH